MTSRPQLLTATLALVASIGLSAARADVIVDFEDIPLAPGAYDNGDPGGLAPGDEVSTLFVSNGAEFNNTFGVDRSFAYPYWGGWAISSVDNPTTPGFGNQYASFAGGGAGGGGNYGVAFGSTPGASVINLPDVDFAPAGMSVEITNTAYTALSMRDGDPFSPAFGGPDGNRADFFLLTIFGYAGAGATGGVLGSVDFYLADYRFSDNALDHIVDTWTTVDLSSLLGSASLSFALTAGQAHTDPIFGLTIPAYFALDNLTIRAVPEPSSLAMVGLGLIAGVGVLRRRNRARPA